MSYPSVSDHKVSDRSMYDHLQVSGQNADLLEDQSDENNGENYNFMCYTVKVHIIDLKTIQYRYL